MNITAIKSPEKMYFCKIEDNQGSKFWGFLSPSDERLNTALEKVEVSIERQQELLSGGYIVYYDGELFNASADEYYLDANADFQKKDPAEVEEEKRQKRQEQFYKTFIETPLGNYRLQPKGYANAQQAMDVTDKMVEAYNGLSGQLKEMVIFYPTPDFTSEEQCSEDWLVAHQYNPEDMTIAEWETFYNQFVLLYATNQYKSN